MIDADQIEAVDDHTVAIHAEGADGRLPILISSKYTAMVPDGMSRENMQAKPVGTGPYMVDEFVPGPKFVAQRNPQLLEAWDAKGALHRVERHNRVGGARRCLAERPGRSSDFPRALRDCTLSTDPNVTVLNSPGGSVMTLSMWLTCRLSTSSRFARR